MKKQVVFTIGATLNGYVNLAVQVEDSATGDQIARAVKSAIDAKESSGGIVFEADWSSMGDRRIATCSDPDMRLLVEAISLDDNPPAICATECFYVHGSVVAQLPVFGLKLARLDHEAASVYGGAFLIAAGVTWEVAQVLANSLGILLKREQAQADGE